MTDFDLKSNDSQKIILWNWFQVIKKWIQGFIMIGRACHLKFLIIYFFRTSSTVLGACGFHGDVLTLTKVLNARLKVIVLIIFWISVRPIRNFSLLIIGLKHVNMIVLLTNGSPNGRVNLFHPWKSVMKIYWIVSFHLLFQMFEHEHHKKMTTSEIAAMLSTMLYHRRFFPYYVYNLIAGIDEDGNSIENNFH